MTFLIAEFDHYESLYSMIKCLEDVATEVCVCSSAAIVKRLQLVDLKGFTQFFWYEAETPKNLLEKIDKFTSCKFDFFIIAPTSHFEDVISLFKIFKSGKKLLWIHNVNFWFQMGTRFRLFKRARNNDHKYMLDIIDGIDAIIVLEENLKAYLKTIKFKKPVIVFPYSIYEKNVNDGNNSNSNKKITIAIPGIIEECRRDYDLALDVFSKLDKSRFKLKLLGLARDIYGNNIIKRVDDMVCEGYDMSYLKSYEQFEFEMTNSDVIFSPINIITSFSGIKEIYGLSKSTGVVFDIVRYSKPAVLPKQLNVPVSINTCVCHYNDKMQAEISLRKFSDSIFLQKITKKASMASENYQLDVVSKQFLEDIKKLRPQSYL